MKQSSEILLIISVVLLIVSIMVYYHFHEKSEPKHEVYSIHILHTKKGVPYKSLFREGSSELRIWDTYYDDKKRELIHCDFHLQSKIETKEKIIFNYVPDVELKK